MGSGIAGRRRLPRQRRGEENAPDGASTVVGEKAPAHMASEHPTDLISPQPLSYEERRDRWLRINGNLWRAGSESPEQQKI